MGDARLRARDTNNVTKDVTEVAEHNFEVNGSTNPIHWFHDTMTSFYLLTNDHP
jgi:hypothetical protein